MAPKVYLRSFEANDYLLVNKWRNNRELQKYTAATFYYTSSETDKAWVIEKMKFSQKEFFFGICLKENDKLIGYCSLKDVDLIQRKCHWGGIVLDESALGKNYAFEASYILMQYAFDELGLNRVMGYWIEGFEASIKLAKKLNFQNEGKLRQSVYKNGKYYDQFVFSLIREDYNELVKRINTSSE